MCFKTGGIRDFLLINTGFNQQDLSEKSQINCEIMIVQIDLC